MNFHLKSHKISHVLLDVVRILRHHLLQGLALDEVGDDAPVSVLGHIHAVNLGNRKSGLLNSGLVQRLVEDVSLGEILIKYFNGCVSYLIDDLMGTCSQDVICLHIILPSLYITIVIASTYAYSAASLFLSP